MHPVRVKMDEALKAIVVPRLRDLGFKGRFPHFRRVAGDRAELVTFQFFSSGGSFVVEIATITAEEIAAHWKADLTLDTVTAQDTNRRHRLGSVNHGDHWFRFGKRNYEAGHDRVEPDGVYRSVAQEVVALLDSDAARWWAGA